MAATSLFSGVLELIASLGSTLRTPRPASGIRLIWTYCDRSLCPPKGAPGARAGTSAGCPRLGARGLWPSHAFLRESAWGRVSATVRNCTRDEGGPFEAGSQVQVSSHRELRSSRAMVVSVAETSGHDPGRQG